jgi:hypothetical protein
MLDGRLERSACRSLQLVTRSIVCGTCYRTRCSSEWGSRMELTSRALLLRDSLPDLLHELQNALNGKAFLLPYRFIEIGTVIIW